MVLTRKGRYDVAQRVAYNTEGKFLTEDRQNSGFSLQILPPLSRYGYWMP
jgi:hypothetical protein